MYRSIYILSIGFCLSLISCEKEEEVTSIPNLTFKTEGYTINGDRVALGGKLKFGLSITNNKAIITNIRVQRFINESPITEMDKGVFIKDENYEFEFYAVKSDAEVEVWKFFIMNSERDSVFIMDTVLLAPGVSYGEINHYPSIKIGMQDNSIFPNYLDLHTGLTYSKTSVIGKEANIDLVGFVYTTSGKLSPTLCCPGYTGSTSVTGFYPDILTWSTVNSLTYDYYSSDNDLVNPTKFALAQNDSLLVASYKPEKVSGLCKYCYTGKIIPFKTVDGKYGLVKVLFSELSPSSYMELEIKIQK